MANIENMLPNEANQLKLFVDRLKETNPDIKYDEYKVDEKGKILARLDAIEGKLDKLLQVFGSYVLINGRFTEIK